MIEGNGDLALLSCLQELHVSEESAICALESELPMLDFKDNCPSFAQKESWFAVQRV